MKKHFLFCVPFLLIEAVFFYIIIFSDMKNINVFSFASIALATLFACIGSNYSKKSFLINIGLFATVCADLFLVLISPQNKLVGMIFFSITQLLYFVYLLLVTTSKNKRLANIIAHIIVVILVETITIFVLNEKTDFLSLISMFYISNSLVNIIFAYTDKKTLLFAIGLTLFFVCDLIIGLQQASSLYLTFADGSVISSIINSKLNIAWMFYLPSQVLISLFIVLSNSKKDVS